VPFRRYDRGQANTHAQTDRLTTLIPFSIAGGVIIIIIIIIIINDNTAYSST